MSILFIVKNSSEIILKIFKDFIQIDEDKYELVSFFSKFYGKGCMLMNKACMWVSRINMIFC